MTAAAQSLGSDSTGAQEKYRPMAVLGHGGMATVHLAMLRGTSGVNKLVVLKSIRSELAQEQEFREMFLDEARLAARLNHPNVVQTYEAVELGGRPVMVMEYLDGQTLAAILQRAQVSEGAVANATGRATGYSSGTLRASTPSSPRVRRPAELPLAIHLRILCEALSGLEYAHTLTDFDGTPLEMVHRDVSPQNVFVTYDGQVKLLDFGIAKALGTSFHTQAGTMKGKIKYMPPEQMLAFPPIDRRADIYAAGVILWEALTGSRLWAGLTDAQIMNRVVHGQVPSPKGIRPDLPDRAVAVVRKALAANRDDRHQSAAELQADIEEVMSEMHLRASNRDVARFVQDLFDDARSETRKIIETQIRATPDVGMSPRFWLDESDGAIRPATLRPATPVPDVAVAPVVSAPPEGKPEKRRRTSPIVVAGALIGFGLAVGLGVRLTTAHDAAPRAVPGPQVAAVPAPPAVPAMPPDPAGSVAALVADPVRGRSEAPPTPIPAAQSAAPMVELRVAATPTNARMFLDGQPVDGNPYAQMIPADGSRHTLRAEAPGMIPKATAVTYDGPLNLWLHLDPAGPRQVRAGTGAHSVSSNGSPTTSAATAVAKPNCDPPFTFDASGIKRLKLECM